MSSKKKTKPFVAPNPATRLAHVDAALSMAQTELGTLISADQSPELKAFATVVWEQLEALRHSVDIQARKAAIQHTHDEAMARS
jgi:hypothetical protein